MQIKWKWVLGIPTIVTVLGSLTYFGLDFSGFRPAWSYEHEALKAIVYTDQCVKIEVLIEFNEGLADQYRARQEPVPARILARIIDLKQKKLKFGCP